MDVSDDLRPDVEVGVFYGVWALAEIERLRLRGSAERSARGPRDSAPALLHATPRPVRWNQGRTTRAVCARCPVKIRCRKLQPLSSSMFFRYISCGVAGSRRLVLELRLPRPCCQGSCWPARRVAAVPMASLLINRSGETTRAIGFKDVSSTLTSDSPHGRRQVLALAPYCNMVAEDHRSVGTGRLRIWLSAQVLWALSVR